MFNESEWDDNLHRFPRPSPREIEQNQRDANQDTENGITGVGWWMLASGLIWLVLIVIAVRVYTRA